MQIKSKHLKYKVNFKQNSLTCSILYIFTLTQCFKNIKLKKIYMFNIIINNYFFK